MKKRFGELLKESFNEYKSNFKTIFIIMLIFSFIPALILTYLSLPSLSYPSNQSYLFYATSAGILAAIISIIFSIISLLMSSSIIYLAFNAQKRMRVSDTLRSGVKFWWKYILLTILIGIIFISLFIPFLAVLLIIYYTSLSAVLILLSIILFIAALVFFAYLLISWIFAKYSLIGENKKIIESMKASKSLVKDKFWLVFGYIILISLISAAISFVFSTISGLVTIPITNLVAASFLRQIIMLISSLITTPLVILFTKNFFLELKKKD